MAAILIEYSAEQERGPPHDRSGKRCVTHINTDYQSCEVKSSRDRNDQTPGLGVHLLPFLVAPYVRGPTYKKEGRLDVKCCNHFYRLPLGIRHFPLPIRRFSILRRHTHDPSFLRCDSMSGRDACQ